MRFPAFVAVIVSLALQSSPVEQTMPGTRPAPAIVSSFDGLGVGFHGPQGAYEGRNPSDNSLAVGPDEIVQTVNTRFAIYTKAGKKHDKTGDVLYGPMPINTFFAGLGGPCDARNNGDTVVRYDQLARRSLVKKLIFTRIRLTDVRDRPRLAAPAPPGVLARPGQASSPGRAVALPGNPA